MRGRGEGGGVMALCSQSPLAFSQHGKRILLFSPELSFPAPRSGSSLCTLGLAVLAVPGVRDVVPLHLGAGEVDPGLTGAALYHGPPTVWLPTVASDLAILVVQVI